jgi:hypothetical protein
MGAVSTRVQKAFAHDVCGANTTTKLSKADKKEYEAIQRVLQIEYKIAREDAETKGWNVAAERAAVTEKF